MPDFSEKMWAIAQERGASSAPDVMRKINDYLGRSEYGDDTMRNYMKGGTKKIPAEFIRDFCMAYRVSPAWLLADVGDRDWQPEEDARRARTAAADWLKRIANGLLAIDQVPEIRLASDVALRRLVQDPPVNGGGEPPPPGGPPPDDLPGDPKAGEGGGGGD